MTSELPGGGRKQPPEDSTTLADKSARGRAARSAGYAAEDDAAKYLEAQGVRLIARNVRFKGGEVDLIGDDAGTLVFFEVRQRKSTRFGGAAASITSTKQGRIVLAAQLYLQRQPALANRRCRFDCVLIDGTTPPHWLRDAFRLD